MAQGRSVMYRRGHTVHGRGENPQEWRGFVEVWREAIQLNRIVVDLLGEAGLPAISLPPSSSTMARDGQVEIWNMTPLRKHGCQLAAGGIWGCGVR